MKRSTDRILVSHTGSLHRTAEFEVLATRHFDPSRPPEPTWDAKLTSAVESSVREQRKLGVDVVNDGEYSKPNWLWYVADRLSGFGEAKEQPRVIAHGFGGVADVSQFPGFYQDAAELDGVSLWRRHSESFFTSTDPSNSSGVPKAKACIGPISYVGQQAVSSDITNLLRALEAAELEPQDGFINVAAPATFGNIFIDEYYGDSKRYLFALADAIGNECRAITNAGLLVQLDDPVLPAMVDMLALTKDEGLELGHLFVETVNRALAGIPAEQVRYHICWGSWNAPHASDSELVEVIDLLYQVNAQTYSIEASNARHDHEWRVFQKHPLPAGKIVMPGIVSHATNIVEHPDGVADRIIRFAEVVGRENVVASTDCGFRGRSHPEVAWAKFRSLSEGARRASGRLW